MDRRPKCACPRRIRCGCCRATPCGWASAISDRRRPAGAARTSLTPPVSWSGRSVAAPYGRSHAPDLLRWFDGCWAGLLTSAILFATAIGSLIVIETGALVALYCVARFKRMPRVLAAIAPVLLLPLFALLSTAWSIAPHYTSYYGIQYLVTVLAGALIGAGTDRRQLIFGLFAAFAVHAVCTALFGDYVDWGGGGASRVTVAFAGVMGSKNAAADAAAIGLMVAAVTGFLSLRERRLFLLAAAGLVMAIDAWVLLRAESAGAIVSVVLALLPLSALAITRPLAPQPRMALFLVAAVAVIAAAVTQEFWLKPLMTDIMHAANKDETLSGRSFIWARAATQIAARPMLGLGYSAFWIRGNLEAEAIWQYMGIASRGGFNFHSTWREIVVHMGYVGLGLYLAVAIPLALTVIVRAVRRPDDAGILFAAYVCYVGARMSVETQGLSPFTHSTLMVAAALASAFRWRSGSAPARASTGHTPLRAVRAQ